MLEIIDWSVGFARTARELGVRTRNVLLTSPVIGSVGFRAEALAAEVRIAAMPLHLEQVEWMPSPPLVPDDCPIDFDHLHRMTLGDNSLEREVLAMFAGQAARLAAALSQLSPEAATLAHKLKGSAQAIGAVHVAAAAADLETALRNGADPAEPRATLNDTVSQACHAIDAILRRV